MIKLIVAVDENWAIGKDNQLLFHIREDLKRFKTFTVGQTVVMGRKTLESMPNGKPLPNRTNIVLSRGDLPKDVTACHSFSELKDTLKNINGEIYIIGGEMIYRALLDFCTIAEVTKVRAKKAADAYFPNLDENKNWSLAEESQVYTDGTVEYTFARYVNNKPRPLGELE